jgi:hypothetical protein
MWKKSSRMFLQELSVEGVSIRAPIYPILAFAASPPHKNNGGGTHKQAGWGSSAAPASCMYECEQLGSSAAPAEFRSLAAPVALKLACPGSASSKAWPSSYCAWAHSCRFACNWNEMMACSLSSLSCWIGVCLLAKVFVQPMKRDLPGRTLKLAESAYMTDVLGDWDQIVGAPLPTSELGVWKNATKAASNLIVHRVALIMGALRCSGLQVHCWSIDQKGAVSTKNDWSDIQIN